MNLRYLKISSLIFRQRLVAIIEYRANFSIRIVTGFLSFLFLLSIWQALRPNDFATALWLFYVLVGLVGAFNGESFYRTMSSDINIGNISFALLQPFPYILRLSSRLIADSMVNVLITLVAITVTSLFLRGIINVDPAHILLAIPLIIVGRVISILLSFLAGCVSFVWLNPDAFYLAIDNIIFVLYGSLIPFWLLPSSIQTAINLFPFRAVIATPAEVMMGRTANLPYLFGVSLVWIVILTVIARMFWSRAIVLYEAVGG